MKQEIIPAVIVTAQGTILTEYNRGRAVNCDLPRIPIVDGEYAQSIMNWLAEKMPFVTWGDLKEIDLVEMKGCKQIVMLIKLDRGVLIQGNGPLRAGNAWIRKGKVLAVTTDTVMVESCLLPINPERKPQFGEVIYSNMLQGILNNMV